MHVRDWLGPPRQVFAIFAAVAVVSTSALGLLSWRLLQQDRLLEIPRRRGLLEAAADSAAAKMTAGLDRLAACATESGSPSTPLPEGASLVSLSPAGARISPPSSLPFVPARAPLPEADPALFADATRLEFGGSDLEAARAAYDALSRHASRAVRATALARLAPVHVKRGDAAAAIRAYEALAALDDVGVGGLPAGLVASAGRVRVLADRARGSEFHAAATALAHDLARGRWLLLPSEYDYYAGQAAVWLGSPVPTDADALARADAAEWLFRQGASRAPSGRKSIAQPRGAAVVIWHASGNRIDAAIGGPSFVRSLVSAAVPRDFDTTLRDLEGRLVSGQAPQVGDVATRVASPDGLPWTLQLVVKSPGTDPADTPGRRLLLLVIGVTALVLGAGWYFIARSLAREARVARLQNDFVASVSHEFRSPLTSLAHVTELLAQDRLSTDARRQQAYAALAGDTARLRDLVEHLLDFGRFDAGAVALRFERADVGVLVGELVADARRRVAEQGFTIDFAAPADPVFADADKDALGRAIANLIDNAVKYSPDSRTIWVDVARDGDRIAITVRDQGLGIPAHEHADIFHRFVRGAESRSRRIRGTGIGLALVRQIVDAHGGDIALVSAPGQGSRFTLMIPLCHAS
jgi:signal transduction histidine kinase